MKTLIAAALLCALAGGAFAGDLPNGRLTPGHTDPALTMAKLCSKGFTTKSVRSVSQEIKTQAYAQYKLTRGKAPCPCEVDHLVSLEIGGSNDITNLWPQSYGTKPWNARVKDRLENQLHKLVCSRKIGLRAAQQEIAVNWIASYKKHCTAGACPPWRPSSK
jgi:hypothetical protein